ncbi:succinyldiaminopimelate transaminase [Oceanitalea stevensii]|uniref:succinyldiaminopimelate transaminase n=1 Tax=Oceanitalea stevensii TaxID=2763072 RepID=UPI002044CF4B|nr:succinyldiaminopimelate transaminase [Oceanitalea stevensii]
MALFGDALPSFPWDSLAGARDRARAHAGGIVDLSVGTPVDPTPQVVQDALVAAADSPGYPTTQGTDRLRESVAGWFARRRGVPGLTPEQVLPTIGSKELVALLPAMLGLGAGDVVVHPQIAYPTYDVGARLAGAEPFPADATTAVGPGPVRLVWLNSPSNPTGRVLGVEHLRKVVEWARARGAVVASDECYAELGWAEPWASEGVPSLLDPRVCGDSHEGLLVLYSASKQSNLAGYRAAFAAGDPVLVRRLLELRKHAGMIMPGPVQAALAAAMDDDEHVAVQRERYRARREVLLAACAAAGLVVAPESEAGLYLWATTAGEADCRAIVAALAERGILAAPGEFYGPAGARHVRIALTASDERVAAAAERLSTGPLLP